MNHLALLAAAPAVAVALSLHCSDLHAGQSVPATGKPTQVTQAVKKKPANRSAPPPTRDEDANEFTNFLQWRAVTEFIEQVSAEHGFDRDELASLFRRANYLDSVVRLINPLPAGKAKNWTAYRNRFVEPRRVKAGIAFWDQYQSSLQRAEKEFGVPAEIIVGIIGVETIYGQTTGKFRLPDTLVTLGFAYPNTPNRDARMAYFRSELVQALLYARENNLDPFSLNGSYAGALGWPQFMPGSIRKFAIDFDGDGDRKSVV